MKKITLFLTVILVALVAIVAIRGLELTGNSIIDTEQGLCIDSDYGKNISTQGETNLTGNIYTDFCEGNKLIEYICHPKEGIMNGTINCEALGFECKDGACIEKQEEIILCNESDGGINAYEAGVTQYGNTDAGPKIQSDKCKSDSQLLEFYCDDQGKWARTVIECENGCEDGACIEKKEELICQDTDENGTYSIYDPERITKGKVSLGQESKEDFCLNNKSLMEYSCGNQEILSQEINCWDTGEYCIEGQCAWHPLHDEAICSQAENTNKTYCESSSNKYTLCFWDEYYGWCYTG